MTLARWTLNAAALVTLIALTAPASAQTQAAGGSSEGSMTGIQFGGTAVDEATLEKRREIEEAYKKATRSQPATQTAVNDPWANMRGADEQKPAAKPAAKTAQKKKPH
jgi:hypothetical protein